ncbi:hypothetical protein CCZ01_01100 [Helicobacter monodelphidis]|uniref:hypothetical protein n=1 Tax=Helicobacter sp. 15-1451 TaxID=2004995 RepID=UPI000DCF4DCE|nr:hypothetical protein [Helicobacter sp. 15-1451]RAX58823.1 hypothetical protein CCZ01_01100 [Helicobacter sp. 15-1451]
MNSVQQYSKQVNQYGATNYGANQQNIGEVAKFQEQIQQLMSKLEPQNENIQSEHGFGFENSNQHKNQSTQEIQAMIAELEAQKNALMNTIQEQVNTSTDNNPETLENLNNIKDQLDAVNGSYFALVSKLLEESSKKQTSNESNNISKEENSTQNTAGVGNINRPSNQDPVDALLNKPLVNSGGSITPPENIEDLYNPLELKDSSIQLPRNSIKITDKYSGKEVVITLDEDNVERLEKKFGSLEKASSYLEGWYNDAAYGVGYLKYDADGNGTISKEEARHLKGLVSVSEEPPSNYKSLSDIFSNEKDMDAFLDEFGFIGSISEFINHSIRQDEDLDGVLNFKELAGENSKEVAKKVINGEVSDIFALNRLVIGKAGESNIDDFLNIIGKMQEKSTQNTEESYSSSGVNTDENKKDKEEKDGQESKETKVATNRSSQQSQIKV